MRNTKEFHDMTDFPATKTLQVNSCGIENHTKFDYSVLRTNGRKDYHFLYIKSGFATITLGNRKVRAREGQCAIFFPSIKQEYSFLASDNPITYFLHFTGVAADEAMTYLMGQGAMIYDVVNKTAFEEIFYQLIRVHNLRGSIYALEENSYLLRLITMLAAISNIPHSTGVRSDIIGVTEYIYEHYHEEVDFRRYAENLYLSYSHFVHLFAKATGSSPHKFLLQVRIDKAKDFLRHTSLSITEISNHVGFSDPLYFSRLFRKYTGQSPSEYRYKYRETQHL